MPSIHRSARLVLVASLSVATVLAGTVHTELGAGAEVRGGRAEGSGPGTTVRPDPSYQQPPFEGWGTALAWFGNVTGGWPEAKRAELADALYSEDGLGFTIARYNIGGGDSPETTPYMRRGGAVPGWWARPDAVGPVPGAPDGRPGPDTRGWWDPQDPEHWDPDADANQRWWLRAAQERGADTFEAFSNSAPYFMTESGYTSGNADAGEDNLRADQYEEFSAYLTGVVERLEREDGVPIRTLSPVNEPGTSYWGALGGQEGSHWDPASQARAVEQVAGDLERTGSSTVVASPDETSPDLFLRDWDGWTPAARELVGQLNTHTYGTSGRTGVRDLAIGTDKPLWMSEVDLGPDGVPQDFDDIRPGLAISERITDDISLLQPRAWVFWQAIEDYRNMLPSAANQNWGMIQVDFATDDPAAEPVRKNKKYYAVGNYSKFIRPGDRVVEVDDGSTLAAIRPGEDRLVVVHTNAAESDVPFRLDLSGFDQTRGARARAWTTSAEQDLAPGRVLPARDGAVTTTVPARSVTTFVVDGVSGVAEEGARFADDEDRMLLNANSDLALTVAADGSLSQQTPDAADPAQRWRVAAAAGGWDSTAEFTLTHPASGRVLAEVSGTPVARAPEGGPAERWVLPTGSGREVGVLNAGTGRVLEVGGSATEPDAAVGVYRPNGGANQSWEVRRAAVDQVDVAPVLTLPGEAPTLPAEATVTAGDGSQRQLAVEWDPVPATRWARPGRVDVTGRAAGLDTPVTATVYVSELVGVEVAPTKTAVGVAPQLPETATVGLAIGGQLELPVTWDSAPPSRYDSPGLSTLTGALELDGRTVEGLLQVNPRQPVNLALNPSGQGYPAATASFTGQYDDPWAVLDGEVSSRRWTNWDPDAFRASDWLEVDLGESRRVDRVRLDFYDDQGGTRPPETVDLQRLDPATGDWLTLTDGPVEVAEGRLTLDVPADESLRRVRLVMTAREGTCIAVSEVAVLGAETGDDPAPGTSATLSGLSVDGRPVAGFDPEDTSYSVPVRGTDAPEVSAEPTDPFATVSVTQASAVPGEAVVTVVSEDRASTVAYRVQLT